MSAQFAFKAIVTGALLSLSSSAMAMGDQWYIGVGGGIAQLQPDPDDTSIDLDEDYGNAGTVFLGWDFDRRSSGQIQLYSLGEATFDDGQSRAGYIAGDASLLYRFFDSRDSAARGTVFGASVYGRFGLGLLERDSDLPLSSDTPVYFGAGGGIEAYLTHNLGVRLEALYHETDAATATLSIVGRFGGRRLAAPPAAPPAAPQAAPLAAPPAGPAPVTSPAPSATNSPIASPGSASSSRTQTPALNGIPDPEAMAGPQRGESRADAPLDQSPLPGYELPEPLIPADRASSSAGENSSGKPVVSTGRDTDGDGVPDVRDQCAESTPGYPVNAEGCALFGGLLSDLVFVGRTAEPTPAGYAALDRLASTLKEYPDTFIEIVAHTDMTGTEAEQSELTRQRLRSIGLYLTGQDISQDRLLLRSYGGKRPAYSNSTDSGRRGNNRIEVFENP